MGRPVLGVSVTVVVDDDDDDEDDNEVVEENGAPRGGGGVSETNVPVIPFPLLDGGPLLPLLLFTTTVGLDGEAGGDKSERIPIRELKEASSRIESDVMRSKEAYPWVA
jgi:hypothetical protein